MSNMALLQRIKCFIGMHRGHIKPIDKDGLFLTVVCKDCGEPLPFDWYKVGRHSQDKNADIQFHGVKIRKDEVDHRVRLWMDDEEVPLDSASSLKVEFDSASIPTVTVVYTTGHIVKFNKESK